MKQYKVIKEFGCAQKGDVLKETEEGVFELSVECDCNDMYCSRFIRIGSDVADSLLSSEYLEVFEEVNEKNKLQEISEHIDMLLEQYASDHEALIAQYNEGDVPQCVKVEADTVYFNMTKVLKHIQDLINE